MRRTAALPFAAASLAVLATASCGPSDASGPEGAGAHSGAAASGTYDFAALFPPGDSWKQFPQVFRWNNDAEPETLDPAKMTGVPEHNLALCLYEGLTTLHPKSLEPIPGIAESWDVSKDGLVYTFRLRSGAKWSNGDPLTAEDVRWSWERALTPATECKYTEMFYAIRGAEAFYGALVEKKPANWSDVGAEVVDPHTLRVTLNSPTPYFLELCAFETLMPVHRATVEKHVANWTQPENFVGNGPFVPEVWKPRDRIELVPNPNWWNRGIVRLTRTIVDATDDLSTSFNKYLAGDVDWVRQVAASKVEEAQRHPDYYVAPYLGTYFFRFNCTKKPFDDVRVRKAFTQAIDKKAICETVLKAGQTPATGVVSPGITGYPELSGLPYDPKRARELLAEAGYPDGKDFPEIAVLYNTHESHKQVCEQMVEMWKVTLGVKVRLENREWKVYLEDTRKLNYDVVRGAWIGDYADPSTFLDMWCKDRGNNNTGWSNPAYDALLAESTKEFDQGKRFALLQKAERMVCVDELPILPVYYYVNQGMVRPRVKGWHENVRDLHPLQYVFLDGPPVAGK